MDICLFFTLQMATLLHKNEDRLTSGHRLSHPPPGDEVLISGVSGYFPDSDSVDHLKDNLFNKVRKENNSFSEIR